ncbi:hypothetical protein ACLOJK_030816 [Asimina triloba]
MATATAASLFLSLALAFSVFFSRSSSSATFTIMNNCPHAIWPGTLSGSGTPPLPSTGFQLSPGQVARIVATPGWSGRIWARTGCTFDETGAGSCQTGDCGGKLECSGMGAAPPATLFEITLGQGDTQDFYDVSLVDGYNLPIAAAPWRGSGNASNGCNATGCVADLNTGCPSQLQVVEGSAGVVACRSACEAFGLAEYCCNGEYGSPSACKPTYYSAIFKKACPRAYSYAYDDGTSTFVCKSSEYVVTFCPNTTRNLANQSKDDKAEETNGPSTSTSTSTCSRTQKWCGVGHLFK